MSYSFCLVIFTSAAVPVSLFSRKFSLFFFSFSFLSRVGLFCTVVLVGQLGDDSRRYVQLAAI